MRREEAVPGWQSDWKLEAVELLDMLRDGVIVVEAAENRIVGWNPAAEKIFGYRPEEAIGMSVSELAPDRLRARHEAGISRYAATGTGHFVENHDPLELPAVTKSGEEIFVEFQLSPIGHSPDGRPYAAAIVRDVTDRIAEQEAQKQLQEIAASSQRLEAVGGLATGVAHDFNNLLAVIATRIDAVLATGGLDAEQTKALEAVVGATERGASLSRQLLAFASKSIVTPSELSLNDALANAAHFLELTLGPGIRLDLQLGEDLPRTMMDPAQVDQVLAHFALNAKDAMPDGGTLTISTDVVTFPAQLAKLHEREVAPGLYVRVGIEDTGIGMDEPTRSRIFEPFFTTKPRGRGTGMGLAMIYGIVTQAGGYIHCESSPGRGAVFEILLPAASIARDHYMGEKDIAPVATRSADILVVDDDPALLGAVVRILERGGHSVVATSSSVEALRLAEEKGAFDLLVSDVVMPEMNGLELARELRRQGIVDQVLLMSGYPEGALPVDVTLGDEEIVLMEKPFGREDLLKNVAERIAAQAERRPRPI